MDLLNKPNIAVGLADNGIVTISGNSEFSPIVLYNFEQL
jgi:hypothetical protein